MQELKDVALIMRELIVKYEKELDMTSAAFRTAMDGKNKNHQRIALRKMKLLRHHIDQAGKRLHNIVSKQYAIEQLGITKLSSRRCSTRPPYSALSRSNTPWTRSSRWWTRWPT